MPHFLQKKKHKQVHFLEELKLGFKDLGLVFREYQNLADCKFWGSRCTKKLLMTLFGAIEER